MSGLNHSLFGRRGFNDFSSVMSSMCMDLTIDSSGFSASTTHALTATLHKIKDII